MRAASDRSPDCITNIQDAARRACSPSTLATMLNTLEFVVLLLAAAVVMVALFRSMNLPPVLGYLPVSYTHLTLPTNREV